MPSKYDDELTVIRVFACASQLIAALFTLSLLTSALCADGEEYYTSIDRPINIIYALCCIPVLIILSIIITKYLTLKEDANIVDVAVNFGSLFAIPSLLYLLLVNNNDDINNYISKFRVVLSSTVSEISPHLNKACDKESSEYNGDLCEDVHGLFYDLTAACQPCESYIHNSYPHLSNWHNQTRNNLANQIDRRDDSIYIISHIESDLPIINHYCTIISSSCVSNILKRIHPEDAATKLFPPFFTLCFLISKLTAGVLKLKQRGK